MLKASSAAAKAKKYERSLDNIELNKIIKEIDRYARHGYYFF